MKKLFLLLLLWAVTPSFSYSQKYYTKQEACDEINYFYYFMLHLHPNMFEMISRIEFEQNFVDAVNSLPDSLTIFNFYGYVSPLVSSIKDGHTAIAPPAKKFYKTAPDVLPFDFAIDRHDLSIMVKDSSCEIPDDSRIIAINGLPAHLIVKKLMDLSFGETQAFKTYVVNGYYSLYFFWLIDNSSSFKVEYIHNGIPYLKTVNAISYEYTAEDEAFGVEDGNFKDDFRLSKLDNETVLLDLKSFIETDDYYKTFFDSTFVYLKKDRIKNLIIDIRGNTGGQSSVGEELLKYISPVRLDGIFNRFSYRVSELTRENEVWKGFAEAPGFLSDIDGYHTWIAPADSHKETYDKSLGFKGDVYVLTDALTFSTASLFSHIVQKNGLGEIVGEATGGQTGAYGAPAKITSPVFGLEWSIGMVELSPDGTGRKDWHPIYPDYEVRSEKALETALELIRQKK